ncbi:fructosamine kinase family protein [Spongiactinospora sp. TRM90649]|uniref:fructosamine kinase family protein n=1 Tax=Spongiactinospora sp. TRM90649 TaxID=3031114 RepID=UPI0023FA1EE3|nr:fructosamine kinase family protein [Spongiactinospora sp. TRM90649]MDF5756517.1 fructosamine kinase family protein [Spongiactinospora sp. TRM90649]
MRILRELGSSHAWRLSRAELPDGRAVFVKSAAETGGVPALFTSEAAGLRWLADAGAVAVPEVLEAADDRLVLSWVEAGDATAETAVRLGRELARMHATGADAFGAPWPGFVAELPMDNTAGAEWPAFYGERRLLPFVRRARDAGQLSAGDADLLDEVIEALPGLAGPAEPPARIHGDLWGGNVLWTAERAVLVDPAAHGGHRETDLAMLALFGAPHLNTIVSAYQDERPLADGWRERVPLHQLHPLLVHVCLYGEAYRGSLLDAAARALAL